ncbi:hypothetical protein [Actinoplanes regularis]|uniref:Uncharacterized protein n=1 Tax=Actinoplanes regularis TaxID=52697 RepID=A0A238WQW3_9ACTN|nr:hypothetical protein [Actinoplanes regularis]GIE84630.1 hypothetical protein Are01nite_11100 [Actinoplanes regularis]GLW33012.1 hypothetical protein Areg01_59500 [Actinoplanes regularis]SNR48723.1 hypothetical protein SAMN06264365_102791 [Actinoplanes regularis]
MTEDSEIVTALRQNPPSACERESLARLRPALRWRLAADGSPGDEVQGSAFANFIGTQHPEALAA